VPSATSRAAHPFSRAPAPQRARPPSPACRAAVANYFSAWNSHDGAAVAALFTPTGTLRDWDVEVHGAAAVGEANAKIFAAVPNIKIEVLRVHAAPASSTATAEILVHVNDEAKTVLKVADVITFDAAMKIVSVFAYKG